MSNEANIFTDSACLGNPDPGGYAAIITIAGQEQVIVGRDRSMTNNKMEMTAAINALEAVPQGLLIVIHSDSQYVIKGATEWLRGWKAKGWRKADGKPVLNQDLWMQMDALLASRTITWKWVKGHTGHPENERVDRLSLIVASRANTRRARGALSTSGPRRLASVRKESIIEAGLAPEMGGRVRSFLSAIISPSPKMWGSREDL
jgi:ribonuclease HI